MSTPRERPILFSGPMVRAILDGRKNQTRRVVSQKLIDLMGEPDAWEPQHYSTWRAWCHHTNQMEHFTSPYGVNGDQLYVRETWRTAKCFNGDAPSKIGSDAVSAGWDKPWAPVEYVVDGARDNWPDTFGDAGKTRTAIHMPRWASRLTLEVTEVHVERLHDISEEDARAEGITQFGSGWGLPDWTIGCGSARQAFQSLWEHINGVESWDANRWVWRISFARVMP